MLGMAKSCPGYSISETPTNFHYKALINCMVLGEHKHFGRTCQVRDFKEFPDILMIRITAGIAHFPALGKVHNKSKKIEAAYVSWVNSDFFRLHKQRRFAICPPSRTPIAPSLGQKRHRLIGTAKTC